MPTSLRLYLHLLTLPGAAHFFLAAFFGRIGIAMSALGLVWLVAAATGSYAVAGAATACFALGEAMVGPQLARLLDRYGQPVVLPWQVAGHFGVAVLVVVLVGGSPPTWVLCATSALLGASIPQLGGVSAARWVALLGEDGRHRLPAAFALEAVANSVVFLGGPVLVSLLGAFGVPEVGSLLAAGLILGSGVSLGLQRRTAPARPARATGSAGSTLRSPVGGVLLALNVCVGLYFGSVQVGVASFATGAGVPAAAPTILAIGGAAGVVGGIVFGLVSSRRSPAAQLLLVASALCVVGLVMTTAANVVVLGVAVAAAEFLIPPTLTLYGVLVEALLARRVLTQAFSWMNSASAAGSALAVSAAGAIADAGGGGATFVLVVVGSLAMVGLATVLVRCAGRRR